MYREPLSYITMADNSDNLVETVSPIFSEMFAPAYEDRSIKEYEYIPIEPDQQQSPATLNNASNITFRNPDKTNFYMLSEAKLELKISLRQDQSTYLATTIDHALVNNGWALFRQGTLRLDEQQIEQKTDVFMGSLIKGLAEYTDDYAQSIGTNEFFYPDTGAGTTLTEQKPFTGDLLAIGNIRNNPEYNQGWEVRRRLMAPTAATEAGEKKITLFLPLSNAFGFLRSLTKPVYGQTFTIDLQRETNWARIIQSDDTDKAAPSIVYIHRARLWVPIIEPQASVELSIGNELAEGKTTSMPFVEWQTFEQQIGNQTTVSWDVSTFQGRPRRVYVAFQYTTRRGPDKTNGAIFDNVRLQRLTCYINNEKYPLRDYEPRFSANDSDYGREYMALLSVNGKYNSGNCEVGSVVKYEQFGKLYAIFCIDCSAADEKLMDKTGAFRLRIDATMSDANSKYIYAVVECDRLVDVVGANRILKYML